MIGWQRAYDWALLQARTYGGKYEVWAYRNSAGTWIWCAGRKAGDSTYE